VQPPAPVPPPDTPAPAPEPVPAFDAVGFKARSDRLSPQGRAAADAVADYLREHPDVSVVITGYAGGRDSLEKNLALAERRAAAVARYLEGLGAPASRMKTASYGSAGHARDGGERANRVEFVMKRVHGRP
jgi:outer membrane protein OmpA-like peptidoglycan-associated protein